jgi:hypothetical protein
MILKTVAIALCVALSSCVPDPYRVPRGYKAVQTTVFRPTLIDSEYVMVEYEHTILVKLEEYNVP